VKRGRRSFEERARTPLLDLWSGLPEFGRPIGCVASTFTFDAGHFEEHCLGRFLDMQSDPKQLPVAYAIEREERLIESPAWVFVDRAHAKGERSLRWNLIPVTLPRGGIQHSKLTLLRWEHAARVIISSANLTEEGYRRNQEVAGVLEFSAERGLPGQLLDEVIEFISALQGYAAGKDRPNIGPQARLSSFIQDLRAWTHRLPETRWQKERAHLVPLLPGRSANLLEQMYLLWDGVTGNKPPRPNFVEVLSPFYNEGADATRCADALINGLAVRGETTVAFQAAGMRHEDGVIEVRLPEVFKRLGTARTIIEFDYIEERVAVEEREEYRPLHAKGIWMWRGFRALAIFGSSNFTLAGLGLKPNHNIELNLAYSIPDTTVPFAGVAEKAWPDYIVLDDPDAARFKIDADAVDDEVGDEPLLPAAFGLALYRSLDGQPVLELEIGADAPPGFQVMIANGVAITTGAAWRAAGRPHLWVVRSHSDRPPSVLRVEWVADGNAVKADWPVNVAAIVDLPPPDALRSLTLQELLEVLTSRRPLHAVVSEMIKRRAERPAATEAVIDPHAKVDTRGFLLQRMREFSKALEGLQERLSRPVNSLDALEWRLSGPIGPLALADQLVKTEPDAAAFMIAEIAGVLRDTTRSGAVPIDTINERFRHTINALRYRANQGKSDPTLKAYVDKAFTEHLA
jgi:hypothetical protein